MQLISQGKHGGSDPNRPVPSPKSCLCACSDGAESGEKFHTEPQHTPQAPHCPFLPGVSGKKGVKSGDKVEMGEEIGGMKEVVGTDHE